MAKNLTFDLTFNVISHLQIKFENTFGKFCPGLLMQFSDRQSDQYLADELTKRPAISKSDTQPYLILAKVGTYMRYLIRGLVTTVMISDLSGYILEL